MARDSGFQFIIVCFRDIVGSMAIRCFGTDDEASVPSNVKVLAESCFSGANLGNLTFEDESQLQRIEVNCFHSCPLAYILTPRSVESIGDRVFAG
jgi:hypothetical protein